MERNVDMQEISDGRKYHRNDMVKLGCNECAGCSACCHNVGDSIVLDPWDMYMLTTHLGCSFEELMEGKIALGLVDGLILPHIQIENREIGCSFLNGEGRCSIHAFRPGMCRLFPLGRLYEDGGFSYFLQTEECHIRKRTKVKISRWLDIPDLEKYEEYINRWHYFCKKIQENAREMEHSTLKRYNMRILQTFFATPYQKGDFYGQFEKRMEEMQAE